MQRIEESELILNHRGAVYHLDLRPEELAPTVITVGDPDRVAEVSKRFDAVEVKTKHREFTAHTGRVGQKRISVVSTGIGPDNIDIVLNELDALVNIDLDERRMKPDLVSLRVIRLGTSGSLQADVAVDSFVASTHAIGTDNLLHFYRHEPNEQEATLLNAFEAHAQPQTGRPYITSAAPGLLKHFVTGFHNGITVTCPGFYGPQGRVLRLGLRHPSFIDRLTDFSFGQQRITNFEMETAAIYGLGRLLGHQCLSLSAIVANRVTKQFSRDGAGAVQTLIDMALEIIASF